MYINYETFDGKKGFGLVQEVEKVDVEAKDNCGEACTVVLVTLETKVLVIDCKDDTGANRLLANILNSNIYSVIPLKKYVSVKAKKDWEE